MQRQPEKWQPLLTVAPSTICLIFPPGKLTKKALSTALACIQDRWLNISHLIIDEFSMMNGDNFFGFITVFRRQKRTCFLGVV
jgi:hypothetical protein